MLIIMSAQMVSEEIALTFGHLPPSFLPYGARRLFEAQAALALGEQAVMTLSQDFVPPAEDEARIAELGVEILRQPPGLTLPEAIVDAVTRLAPVDHLRILRGDRLIAMEEEDILASDIVAATNTIANCPWAFAWPVDSEGARFSYEKPQRISELRVVCGYFTFSDPQLLLEACGASGIVDALNAYAARKSLNLREPACCHYFGQLPLLFRAKREVLVARSFNDLKVEGDFIVKRSAQIEKIRAEASWYEALPPSLAVHCPRYAGRADGANLAGYMVEYLNQPVLSELFALGRLPLEKWLEIFRGCRALLDKLRRIRPEAKAPEATLAFAERFFDEMIVEKSWARVRAFAKTQGFGMDARLEINGTLSDPLGTIIAELISGVPRTRPADICYWHGDLFFGNMFYDFSARRIICVDPRGRLEGGEGCLYGDYRYDLAKLAHSVLSKYDKIILGRYGLKKGWRTSWDSAVAASPNETQIEAAFLNTVVVPSGISDVELQALTGLLFMSMLPLHDDDQDRQMLLLSAGLECHGRMKEAAS